MQTRFASIQKLFNDSVTRFIWESSSAELISFQCTLSLPLKSIRKPDIFLIFSGGREMVHWKQMGVKALF